MSTFPCQNTLANTSNVLSDLPPKIHVIQPTNRQYQHIAKALSMKKYQTKTQLLKKKNHQRHTSQGQVITVLLTGSLFDNVTDLYDISACQDKRTLNTKRFFTCILLNYAFTYTITKICYHASNTILHVGSDATSLFMPGAYSCIYGQYYLSDHPANPTNP